MRLVAFCEAPADFRIAADLADRVLREEGPVWVGDVLDAEPEGIRVWQSDGRGQDFFDVHDLTKHVTQLGIRVPHGHFSGKPGAADAVMGRTAFAIVRRLVKQGEPIDAVLMIRDMDDQPEREAGLGQARAEAQSWADFQIVLGCANPMREAWVLCGFEPEPGEERERAAVLRQELGFAPHLQAHELTAADEQAKRSAKRVLRVLIGDDRAREERCWTLASLATLRARGERTGLRAYLDELAAHLLPFVHHP